MQQLPCSLDLLAEDGDAIDQMLVRLRLQIAVLFSHAVSTALRCKKVLQGLLLAEASNLCGCLVCQQSKVLSLTSHHIAS